MVGGPVQEQHHGHLIFSGKGCLLVEFAGDSHASHAPYLEIDYDGVRLLGRQRFPNSHRVFMVDKGVIGFGEGGVDVVACPFFVGDDDDS